MNSDFREILLLFAKHEVKYLIVGGYAAMHYSQPRFTKDLNIWLQPDSANITPIMSAFQEFGMPLIDVCPEDFGREGLQYMVGRSPVLFDFLTSLPGMDFSVCWQTRNTVMDEEFPIFYMDIDSLIKAKKLAARPQDLIDIAEIQRNIDGRLADETWRQFYWISQRLE